MDINQAINDFLDNCKINNFSSRTIESYKSSLGIWQRFIANKAITDLDQITKEILLDYCQYLQTTHRSRKGQPLAAATQIQKISTLRAFIDYCNKTGKILLRAADHLPKPKQQKKLPKGIATKRQIKKLLQLPDTSTLLGFRDRVILELFYATGIRRKELVAIQLEDVYLVEKCLFIRDGKGGKQRWLPLGKQVTQILQQYIEQIRPQLVKDKKHNYLIVANKGGKIYGSNTYTIVKKYLNLAGINSDCHGLRHTCATHMLKGNANIRVIQSVLGHTSLSSTQIYTHVDISEMAKAIEKAHPRENMMDDY